MNTCSRRNYTTSLWSIKLIHPVSLAAVGWLVPVNMRTVKVVWFGLVAALLILQKQQIAAHHECDDEGGCKLSLPVLDYDFEYDEESPLGSVISSQKSLTVNKTQDAPRQKFVISGNASHVLAHLNPADFSDEEGEAPRLALRLFGNKKSKSGTDTTTEKSEKKKKPSFGKKLKSLFKTDGPKTNKTLSTKEKKKEKKEKNAIFSLFNKGPAKAKKENKPPKSSNSALSKLWKNEKNKGSNSGNSTAKAEKAKKKKKGFLNIFNFKKDKKSTNKNGTLAVSPKPKKPKTESKTAQKLFSIFNSAKSKKEGYKPANNSSEEVGGQEPKKKRKGMKKVKHVAMKVLTKVVETTRTLWEQRKELMEELPFRVKNATLGRLSRHIKAELNISIDLMEGWDAFEQRIADCADDKKELLELLWTRIHDKTLKCAGNTIKQTVNIITEFKQIGLKVRRMKKEVKTKLSNCVLGIGPDGMLDLGDEKISRDEIIEHLPNEISLQPGEDDTEGWGAIDDLLKLAPSSTESDVSLGGDSNEETDVSSELSDDGDDDDDSDDDDDDDIQARHSIIRRDLMALFTDTLTCGTKVFRDAINDVTAMPGKIVSLVEAAGTLLKNEGGATLECFASVIREERKTLDRMAAIMGACAVMGV